MQLLEQISNNDNIKDMTKEGKCSRCGECCGLFIPFTKKELKIIKEYVNKNNIKLAIEKGASGVCIMSGFMKI